MTKQYDEPNETPESEIYAILGHIEHAEGNFEERDRLYEKAVRARGEELGKSPERALFLADFALDPADLSFVLRDLEEKSPQGEN